MSGAAIGISRSGSPKDRSDGVRTRPDPFSFMTSIHRVFNVLKYYLSSARTHRALSTSRTAPQIFIRTRRSRNPYDRSGRAKLTHRTLFLIVADLFSHESIRCFLSSARTHVRAVDVVAVLHAYTCINRSRNPYDRSGRAKLTHTGPSFSSSRTYSVS